jgi:hypothetical protein
MIFQRLVGLVAWDTVTSLQTLCVQQVEAGASKRLDWKERKRERKKERETRGLSLSVGMKVVAFLTGRKGVIGWYDATVVQVDAAKDEYEVEWHDAETKDAKKSAVCECHLCVCEYHVHWPRNRHRHTFVCVCMHIYEHMCMYVYVCILNTY